MKKTPSSKSPGAPKRQKTSKNASTPRQSRKTSKKRDDPFAAPPHPLGFNFLSEERPIRASKFGAILPTLVAKYGFGRKIGVERFHNAWNDALATVFRAESLDGWNDWDDWNSRAGEDGWNSRAGEDGWNSRVGEDDWNSRAGEDGWNSRVGEDDWNSRAGEDGWNNRVGEDGWNNRVGENGWDDWGSGENWRNAGDEFAPTSKLATYARHARPVAFRGGTLSVCVESRLLCQELSFYLPQILREIQTALPDENVERIKLVVR